MKTILTGIKPTNSPHIGNYIGAIRPALELAKDPNHRAIYFIADGHALTSLHNPQELQQQIYEIAACWLACGLDPARMLIYRQSDIPEIFEISWILSCFTAKGLMNRAHAYKACVQHNEEQGNKDPDSGINVGLYTYPVLMSADILFCHADLVPVGEDQLQHIEIARDIAQKFNHNYKTQFLKIPQSFIQKNTALVPGLDGRKMSKSYNNGIPLFCSEKKLQKLINKITTDSTPPEAPKDPKASYIYQLYCLFASATQIQDLENHYATGISWGEAKKALFEVINDHIKDARSKYDHLIQNSEEIEKILLDGAEKTRAIAISCLTELRKLTGLKK